MKFVKYPSIDNWKKIREGLDESSLLKIPEEYREAARAKFLHYKAIYDTAEWVAMEKIHGANFSVLYDGKELKVAKHSAILDSLKCGDSADGFYNCLSAINPLQGAVIKLFKTLQETRGISQLQIHGELFGGRYLHPEVKKLDFKHVQKEVQYSPKIEFWAFDLRLDGSYPEDVGIIERLAWLSDAGIPTIPIAHRGRLSELLTRLAKDDACIPFPTTIPGQLGLPIIKNNWAEGWVLRPVTPKNILIKLKTPSFTEVHTTKTLIPSLTGECKKYLTSDRYFSARSRIEYHPDKLNDYITYILEDMEKDYSPELRSRLASLTAAQKKSLSNQLSQAARRLVLHHVHQP